MIRRAYNWTFRHFISRSDPEQAHHLGLGAVAEGEGDFGAADGACRHAQGIYVAQGGPHESPRKSTAPCEGDRTQAQVVCRAPGQNAK